MIQHKQACVRGPNDGFPQVIYIAPMSDPWTIDGARHEVAAPELAWEEARIRPDSTRSTALVCYGGTAAARCVVLRFAGRLAALRRAFP